METSLQLKNAIKEYKQGDKDAFTTIYQETEKYIYSCIYKVMKGNNNALDMTEDVMGDTYLEISQSIGQLVDEEKFLSWAAKIATRKCYAYLKKNKKEILLGEEDTTFEQLADDDNIIPEEVMQNREAQRLLREIIDRDLNEMQKLCIIGFYYNEQKQSEIAKELGIPENTVKTHLSRAKAKIKAGVEELHIKKGTKLYSVAPILLLLFKEDVQACQVPVQVGAKVLGTVGASVGTAGVTTAGSTTVGTKGLIGKIMGASVKTKVVGTIVALGVVGGSIGTFMFANNSQEVTWESMCEEYIENNQEVVGFDLNDFDGDGVPEIVANFKDSQLKIMKYDNGVLHSLENEQIGVVDKALLSQDVESKEVVYGYGSEFDEMIYFEREFLKCEDETIWVPRITDKHYKGIGNVAVTSYREKIHLTTNSETGKREYDSSEFSCQINNENTGKEYTFEEWLEEADAVMKSFNYIEFAGVTKSEVKERIAEFKENGNRVRSNSGFDWNQYDERNHFSKEEDEAQENIVDLEAVCDEYHNRVGGDELYRFIQDFDKDGNQEAFLILGEYSSEGSHTVSDFLYFNSKGESTDIPITNRGDSPTFFGYVTGDKIVETETRDYLVWEKDAFGSSSISYIFSVKNGEYFEPEISGEYMSFGLQSDGSFKGWKSDFSAGYQDYIETEFVQDKNSGEFLKK